MLNKEKKVQPTSKSGNDAKPIVTGSAIVEICYRRLNGDIAVHYRREAGTEDANDLIAQVEEHQLLHGEAARYFHRIAM